MSMDNISTTATADTDTESMAGLMRPTGEIPPALVPGTHVSSYLSVCDDVREILFPAHGVLLVYLTIPNITVEHIHPPMHLPASPT